MQKQRNMKLEVSQVENIQTNKNTNYNHKHQFTNLIREEVAFLHTPPKNSLSELIFNDSVKELQKRLKNSDIDPDARDSVGSTFSWTPLYWGVKLKRIECVKVLLEFGVDINVVINDCEECCGTVLDLATLRDDLEMENLLREYAEKEDVNLGRSFKAIRTKLRGRAPAFNFKFQGNSKKEVNQNN